MRGSANATQQGKKQVFLYKRPFLYPKQLAAIFNESRYSIVEASTKAGKTVSCIIWLFEQAYKGASGQNFWWIAPIYPQAHIAFTRTVASIPRELVASIHNGDLRITLINGAVIWFKSGEKPDNLYGEDVYAAVIDEASRMREESWHAVRSTLTATRGPVRIIGNVRGRKSWMYALARKAEAGAPGMSYHKIVAADAVAAGVLHKDEIEDARSVLPEQVFKELYLAEPSDDGGNPFGLRAIAACVVPTLSVAQPVCWGWDLAKHVDWTVGIALDKSGQVCRFLRFQKPWDATMATILSETRGVPALIDSTGVGDPIVELLQKKPGTRFEGYSFNSNSKQKLMEGLAVAVQSTSVRFPEGTIRREMEDFEYEYTRTGVRYTAPEGFHDDCVCSLALAVMQKSQASMPIEISDHLLAASMVRKR